MNVVDSCGWLEYVGEGANAAFFSPAIENLRELLVPSICLLEVFKVMCRQRGEGAALRVTAAMRRGRVANLDAAIAVGAARLGMEHGLPMADSVVLATARLNDAALWTQDDHFEGMPGVKYRKRA